MECAEFCRDKFVQEMIVHSTIVPSLSLCRGIIMTEVEIQRVG